MLTLPLIAPAVSEMLAGYYLDRGAVTGPYRAGEWSGLWQNAATRAGAGGGWATGDVLAWVMVAFFLLTLGVIAGCILALRSRPAGLTPEQQLIEEVQRNEDTLAYGTAPAREGGDAQPWERDPEWWRGDEKE